MKNEDATTEKVGLSHLARLGGHSDSPGPLSEGDVAGGLPDRVVVGDGLNAVLPGYGDVAGVVSLPKHSLVRCIKW